MRRIRYTTVLLILTFCMLPIVCILMFHHLNLAETLSKIGRGSLGKSDSNISVQDQVEVGAILSAFNSERGKNALYLDLERGDCTIRYIYFNKSYPHLPMESGRFFMRSDFSSGRNTAVVGKNCERFIETSSSGDRTITIDEIEYEVIGTVGYEAPTMLDDYIYLNFNSLPEIGYTVFTLDALSSDNASESASAICERLKESGINAEPISNTIAFNDIVMPKVSTARWFIFLLACCLICLLLISIQWTNSYIKEISVRMLCGAATSDIALLITKKYLLITAFAFVVGELYCYIKYPAYLFELFGGYAIALILIVIFLFGSIRRLTRVNIQEALK